ncbi:MAG: response regulator [Bdellovibrionaceae bacterium]|nr:response regulator [Pseudobdellovibrionaceae bacterium]
MHKLLNKKILIVEDDALMRETLQELFHDLGVIVAVAENGRDAYEILLAENYDAVISDMRMPGMDGLALARHINGLAVRPLVFICSGYNDISESQRQSLQIEQIFEKPFNLQQMVEALSVALSRVRSAVKS